MLVEALDVTIWNIYYLYSEYGCYSDNFFYLINTCTRKGLYGAMTTCMKKNHVI